MSSSSTDKLKKNALLATAGVAGVTLLYWAGLYANQRALVFNPVAEELPQDIVLPLYEAPRADELPQYAEYQIYTQDGVCLRGVKLSHSGQNLPTLLYVGGRGEDIRWFKEARGFFKGVNLVALNYRGFGLSEGKCSEQNAVADVIEHATVLSRSSGVSSVHLVGRSLGTGVVIQAIKDLPQAASLSLITPYDSIVEIAKMRFPLAPVNWLLSHRFESHTHVQHVKTPTQVLLAEKDDIVPHTRTKALISKFKQEPETSIIGGCDHCNIVYRAGLWENLIHFAKEMSAKQA